MAFEKPTPIILCGGTEKIGASIIAGLSPDYEAVHFILTPSACVTEIPLILRGELPANPSSKLGTGNVTDRPVAIVTGGAYAEGLQDMYEAVERACGPSGSGLPWLKNDTTKPGPDKLGADYPNSVVTRLRGALDGIKLGGIFPHQHAFHEWSHHGLHRHRPLAVAAQCDDSMTCVISDWACIRLCEMRGHTAGGVCEKCKGYSGQNTCSCRQGKMRRGDDGKGATVDGDAYVDIDVEIFKREFDAAVQDEEPVLPRALDKRSFCCSPVPPFSDFCCEKSCQGAGRPEEGQCSADNMCTCG